MTTQELAIRIRVEIEDKIEMNLDVTDRLEVESILQHHLLTARQEAMKEQREKDARIADRIAEEYIQSFAAQEIAIAIRKEE